MTLKKYLFFLLWATCLVSLEVSGQTVHRTHPDAKDELQLEKQQDSLSKFAYNIVNAPEPDQRFRADSFFIRMLVRSLKIPNSFYFHLIPSRPFRNCTRRIAVSGFLP